VLCLRRKRHACSTKLHRYRDILLGLIHEGEGVAAKSLENLGISLDAVREQVQEIIGQGQQAPSATSLHSPRQEGSRAEPARGASARHNYIGTEHILLGLIREARVGSQVLVKLGADLNRVRQQSSSFSAVPGKEHQGAGVGPAEAPRQGLWSLTSSGATSPRLLGGQARPVIAGAKR